MRAMEFTIIFTFAFAVIWLITQHRSGLFYVGYWFWSGLVGAIAETIDETMARRG